MIMVNHLQPGVIRDDDQLTLNEWLIIGDNNSINTYGNIMVTDDHHP